MEDACDDRAEGEMQDAGGAIGQQSASPNLDSFFAT
jgi:hypothetical protein